MNIICSWAVFLEDAQKNWTDRNEQIQLIVHKLEDVEQAIKLILLYPEYDLSAARDHKLISDILFAEHRI